MLLFILFLFGPLYIVILFLILSRDQWNFIAQRPLVHLLIYGCVKANLMKIDDKGLFINYAGGRQIRGDTEIFGARRWGGGGLTIDNTYLVSILIPP